MSFLAADQSEGGSQRWFAVRVRSHFERITSTNLKDKGYEEFTPFYKSKRRWSDRTKEIECPVFPGYVFCRFVAENRLPVLQTAGVVSIVSFDNRPAPICDQEIADLKVVMNNGHNAVPWPYFACGAEGARGRGRPQRRGGDSSGSSERPPACPFRDSVAAFGCRRDRPRIPRAHPVAHSAGELRAAA